MQQIMLPMALVFLVTGLVLRLATRKHLTEFGRSRRWYNPAHWFTPPWKASTLFTPQGVRLFWVSTILIEIGAVLYLINMWLY